jgi:predicted Zn-ribbon and HTH transcriptional regulator
VVVVLELHHKHKEDHSFESHLMYPGADSLTCKRCFYRFGDENMRPGPVHCPVCDILIADLHRVESVEL